MKLKLLKLVSSAQALSRLNQLPLPAKIALNVARITKVVEAELQTYEATRKRILEQYGKLSNDKTQYVFTVAGSEAACTQGVLELLDQEIDLVISQIDFADIETAKIDISGAELNALEWLIKTE